MACLPADEDYARALISIFQARQLRARQSMKVADVRSAFLGLNMGRIADFNAALQYATSQGWLRLALDMVRLTPRGADELQMIAGFL
jgi:hypothetical protein